MYQNIDFSKTGGFPLTQNTMDFIQSSYNDVLAAASHALGEYIILTGVVETPASSNNYTAGWITYEGEIIPFVAGVGTNRVGITETTETLEYNNGDVNNVVKTRKAGFVASGGVLFSNYKRLSLETLKTDVSAVKVTADNALATANAAGGVPVGVIVMWSGSIASIPSGWALCDGGGGRPNLSGRFIVGYDSSDADYNAIGDSGGSKKHVLQANEISCSFSHYFRCW